MATTNDVTTQLPAGIWEVDPEASELGFGARGMFGLVPVKGRFGEFGGTLTVDPDGARGELRIQAASLDTRNGKRDTHLRSADFFDVEKHPVVTFELTEINSAADGTATVAGVLKIRENRLPVEAPVHVDTTDADRVKLHTDVEVDRAAAGVGWSKLGMIKGKAKLHAEVTLTRAG